MILTMSSPAAAKPKSSIPEPKAALAPRPLRPRKKLFIILCLVLAAWIIALVVMYFTLVFPHGHHLNGAPT